ncbi:MAG: TonB-dependent receptor [Pseudomonadales bacterium]|nr:TonB-dependent receptor [Pseudomonadales bacterium]
MKYKVKLRFLVALSALLYACTGLAAEGGKKLEEVVVYGERVEATVSDTSVAITAMDSEFLEDMGLQGPDEMINFIPAATRTAWDIKIRGVGRNFRGLGGDPGIGTYYNGAYSPDFGIASTEGALYDVNRVEVLRGPQGTLYGRNSIGGVVNYVTNQPNHYDFEAQARVIGGKYNTREFYGLISGPINDSLAYRLVGSKRLRDGAIEGLMSEDVANVNDQNIALTLDWQVSDNLKINVRGNDRTSRNNGNFGAGGHGVTSEGPCVGQHPITSASQCDPRYRVARDTNHYATGFRGVSEAWYNTYGDLADDPRGAVPWIHPVTGATVYGAYNRPGVDPVGVWPYMPTGNYMSDAVGLYNIGDAEAPDIISLTNNTDREEFDHAAGTLTVDYDFSSTLAARYIFAYQNFDYGFNRDNDYSNSLVGNNEDTDLESVDSYSHELRVFWQLGDRWTATSGLYYFWEDRHQL